MPDDERLFDLAEMIRRGYSIDMIEKITGVDKWFLYRIDWIVKQEEKLKTMKIEDVSKDYLNTLKKKGFSDKGIADLMKISPEKVYELRYLYIIFMQLIKWLIHVVENLMHYLHTTTQLMKNMMKL